MSNMTEKLRQRLLKLAELARRGLEGEAISAQAMMDKLLRQNGIKPEELEDLLNEAEKAPYDWTADSKMETQLLILIAQQVTGDEQVHGLVLGLVVTVLCTRAQKVEISVAFSVYRQALAKEVEKTFIAFVGRNEIYAPSDEENGERPDEEVMERMQGMERTIVRRQLTNGGGLR